MPTYTYEERVTVCRAVDASGAALCPRCGSPISITRMQTVQDKMLKRPGKPLYRCSNRGCACECTPISHLTAVPLRKTGTDDGPRGTPPKP